MGKLAADTIEIRRALQLLYPPPPWRDFCVELRVPGTAKGTVAGYFTDPEKLAVWAARLSGGFNSHRGPVKVEAVYVSLNPLTPALLARAANRCAYFMKHTAQDADVLHRNWLGIDFDPVRPSGVSSTDGEHERALERARQAREWLRGLGWPEPILADSGNGAHLLFRVDLPNTQETTELVRRVVAAVAAFYGDNMVDVDLKVHNAARLWKLYGTLAAKGDDLPERPHRLARLLEIPTTLEVVPLEALQRVAAMVPATPRGPVEGSGARVDLDVGAWLEKHGLEIYSEKEWNGGRLWVLRRCPWNPEHTNLSSFVYQGPDGRVTAKCHHNSCRDKGWADLRDLLEPGWKEKEKAPEEPGLPWLPSPVSVPEGWDGGMVVVTTDWKAARRAYAEGKAVIVLHKDLSAPRGAGEVLRKADKVEVVAEGEEKRRLEWELFPVLAAKTAGEETGAVVEVDWQKQDGPADSSAVAGENGICPEAARARQIVKQLLDRHGIWVYRTGDAWAWANYEFLHSVPPPEAQALLEELGTLPPEVVASAAAMVPPGIGDTVETPRWTGEITGVKLPVQVAVRLPDNSLAYYDPHPYVLAPAGPGRWRARF